MRQAPGPLHQLMRLFHSVFVKHRLTAASAESCLLPSQCYRRAMNRVVLAVDDELER